MTVSKVRGEVNPADVLTKPNSLEDMRTLLLNVSCIDWHDHSRAPSTHYTGDRVGYEGYTVFKDNRIEFVNSVGECSVRRRGSDNRDSCGGRGNHGRGIQIGLPYTRHCVDSIQAGFPYKGHCILNRCVGKNQRGCGYRGNRGPFVERNQRSYVDRGNHGISNECVDSEDRKFSNRRDSYGSNRCDIFNRHEHYNFQFCDSADRRGHYESRCCASDNKFKREHCRSGVPDSEQDRRILQSGTSEVFGVPARKERNLEDEKV